MGERIGNFEVVRRLAQGGMAEVLLAKQRGMGGFERLVCLKRILPHLRRRDDFLKMFQDEARIAANLMHPNIAQIYAISQDGDDFFIAMEYVRGEDLRRVYNQEAARGSAIPLEIAAQVVMGAAAGLDYAHRQTNLNGRPLGLVHRDISPQNIVVTFDGHVKLIDFGVAKAADKLIETRSGVLKGKYSYMSPEQASGKPVDSRTDIFALGITLYEVTLGTRLFKRETELDTLQAVIACEVPPPRSVLPAYDVELERIVMRALAAQPKDRFVTAGEMEQALERYLHRRSTGAGASQLAAYMHDLFAEKLTDEALFGGPPWNEPDTSQRQRGPEATVAHGESGKQETLVQPPPERPQPAVGPPPPAGGEATGEATWAGGEEPAGPAAAGQPPPEATQISEPHPDHPGGATAVPAPRPPPIEAAQRGPPEQAGGAADGWETELSQAEQTHVLRQPPADAPAAGEAPEGPQGGLGPPPSTPDPGPGPPAEPAQPESEGDPALAAGDAVAPGRARGGRGPALWAAAAAALLLPLGLWAARARLSPPEPAAAAPGGEPAEQQPEADDAPLDPSHAWLTITAPIPLEVTLGSRYLGDTPLRRLALEPGSYRLRLQSRLEGVVLRRNVHLQTGNMTHVQVSDQRGGLHVWGRPWAWVQLGLQAPRETPLQLSLIEGEYSLTFECPDGRRHTTVVEVVAGGTQQAGVDCERAAPPGARP